ncbi:hypothetical protein CCAX7_61560 [Capsulimonas corticalis]|uniref:Uncharacterized protein n=1 Tax=Capsulimonas corticalis TaxID=2219043 RepID=A0A402CWD7_9BACT|nr:hypothetical protein CCAX7_61560 [Capsulimonas corticalis]
MPISDRDHSQGPTEAVVTLLEYGDYADPKCADAQPRIRSYQARMGCRLRFVFRHFPTPGLRAHAAEAAEAAGRQGRFWEMHDTLFEHQSALGSGHIVEYARDLGLDMDQFLRDMTGHVSGEHVRQDRESGVHSGVTGAPAFFINGARRLDDWEEIPQDDN